MSGVISGFVEGGRGKGQWAAGKEEKTTEGGRDAEGKDGSMAEGESGRGRGSKKRRANEEGIRRTLSTSNRAGSKSPKDSNTSMRWGSVKTSEQVDGTHLSLFHGFHCEPFTTFTFGRKEGGRGRLTVSRSMEQRCGLNGVGRRERTYLDEILGVVSIEFPCHFSSCFVAE